MVHVASRLQFPRKGSLTVSMLAHHRCPLFFAILVCFYFQGADSRHIGSSRYEDTIFREEVKCGQGYERTNKTKGCHPKPKGGCGRIVIDDFATVDEVTHLKDIAETFMANATTDGGPTLADINSGYVRDQNKIVNMYENAPTPIFTKADYDFYRSIIERIRERLMAEFGLSDLWFTAPTFITRLIGGGVVKQIHDEYWHTHVDKGNNPLYDWSGLLYLSSYGDDFEGGVLEFEDEEGQPDLTIEPRAGRLLIFSAGEENPHRVSKVTNGRRYVLSFWFTCDKRYEFSNFLDAAPHKTFDAASAHHSEL